MEKILLEYWFNPQIGYLRYLEATLMNLFLAGQKELQRPFLDVGCGSGRFAKELSLNIDEGIDISKERVTIASRANIYKKCWQCSIDDLPKYGKDKYGLVIANSVLEHLPKPRLAINAIRESLRNNGILLLTVPLKKSEEYSQFGFILSQSDRKKLANSLRFFYAHETMKDFRWWTSLLQKSGFSILISRYYVFGASQLILDALNPFNTRENEHYSFPSDEFRLASQKTLAKMWSLLLAPYIEIDLKLSELSNKGVNFFVACQKK